MPSIGNATSLKKILEEHGDYALALKGNQGSLHKDAKTFFDDPVTPLQPHTTVAADHGRIETPIGMDFPAIGWLPETHQWPGFALIGKIIRHRAIPAGKLTTEMAYYRLSMLMTAERFGQAVRFHWGVENRLHWVLAVTMNEDRARNRKANGLYNLAVLRHIAVTIGKDKSKGSARIKLNRAAWQNDFLARLLAQTKNAIAVVKARRSAPGARARLWRSVRLCIIERL